MSNILTISKKEFSDLVNSKLVLLILVLYVLIFALSFYNNFGSIDIASLSSQHNTSNDALDIIAHPAGTFASIFIIIVCYYGSLVAVVLGYSSMSTEADGKAISTLLVKPLYRDTIVNGKLLGAFCFLICIFWASVALYICGLFLFFGGAVVSYLYEFLGMISLGLIIYILATMLAFSLSMLMCISFKEQSFALFMGFLSWVLLFYVTGNMIVAGYIAAFFHFDSPTADLFNSLIPQSMISDICSEILNGNGILSTLSNNLSGISIRIFTLALYCFITIFVTYSVFLRRDVS